MKKLYLPKAIGIPSLWTTSQRTQKLSQLHHTLTTSPDIFHLQRSPPLPIMRLSLTWVRWSNISCLSCRWGICAEKATLKGFVHRFPMTHSSGRAQWARVEQSHPEHITGSGQQRDFQCLNSFNAFYKMHNSWLSSTFFNWIRAKQACMSVFILHSWNITFSHLGILHKIKVWPSLVPFVHWNPQIIHSTCKTVLPQLTRKPSLISLYDNNVLTKKTTECRSLRWPCRWLIWKKEKKKPTTLPRWWCQR